MISILYHCILTIFIIFIASKIIPDGLAWITLMDYLDSYRDYCYLSCTEENEGYSFDPCPSALSEKKVRIISWLEHIGQKDKIIINYKDSFNFCGKLFFDKVSVFEKCLSLKGWKNIEIGWEFIAMLEQAVMAYENRLKEKLSLLFWIDYFKLLYQNLKTLIKRRLTTP